MIIKRIVAIGDLHGRTQWVQIAEKEIDNVDHFIFMGDYFDSHDDISAEQQIDNFLEIVEFKKANMDKVILLIGNHDTHYMGFIPETYSGYQYGASKRINEILKEALPLMQMCVVHDIFVFTHAGVTKTWASNTGIDISDLENSINEKFIAQPRYFGFTMGDNWSQTGNDVTQPPIWVRPQALLSDALDDIVYVVGHTTVAKLGLMKELPNLILIDCLGTTGEYLYIDGDIATAKKP
jgi:predicted phosphodiesterase